MGGFAGPLAAMTGMAANIRGQGQRDALVQAMQQMKMQQLADQSKSEGLANQMESILADPNAKPEDIARALRTLAPAGYLSQIGKGGANQALSQSYSSLADSQKDPLKKAALQQAANAAAAGATAPEIHQMLAASGLFTDTDLTKYRQLRNTMLQFQVDILKKLIDSHQIDKALQLMGTMNAGGGAAPGATIITGGGGGGSPDGGTDDWDSGGGGTP